MRLFAFVAAVAFVLAACRSRASRPHGPTGCAYTHFDAECTYAKTDVDPYGLDDAALATVEYDYAGPSKDPIGPLREKWRVPRDRTAEFVAALEAQKRVTCHGEILASGSCPPDTTRVGSVDVKVPPWATRQ
jgi:hypothetical protein